MVLRTFAREANLSGNYEVELDETQAVYMGVNAMLSSLNSSDGSKTEASRRRQLMVWLRQYMLQKLDEGQFVQYIRTQQQDNRRPCRIHQKSLNETYKLNRATIVGYLEDPERIMRFSAAINRAGTSVGASGWRMRPMQLSGCLVTTMC